MQQSPLRSGKWLPEEEAYAAQLIAAFEGGVAADCANGATLRSYLAAKLHCAPMRISKKFAGRGIGKRVYLGGATNLAHAGTAAAAAPPQPDPALAAKLRETEREFRQATAPVVPDFFAVRCWCCSECV